MLSCFTLDEWFIRISPFKFVFKRLQQGRRLLFSCQIGSVLSPWMENGSLLTCIDESQGKRPLSKLKRFSPGSLPERGKDWSRSRVRAFLDISFASNLASASNECYKPKFQLWGGTTKLISEHSNPHVETDQLRCWMVYLFNQLHWTQWYFPSALMMLSKIPCKIRTKQMR